MVFEKQFVESCYTRSFEESGLILLKRPAEVETLQERSVCLKEHEETQIFLLGTHSSMR